MRAIRTYIHRNFAMHRAGVVLQFCGVLERISLAGVDAKWRAVPEIVEVLAIIEPAFSGNELGYLELLSDSICLAPSGDPMICEVDMAARVAAQLAATPGMFWAAEQIANRFTYHSVVMKAATLGGIFSGNVYDIAFDASCLVHFLHQHCGRPDTAVFEVELLNEIQGDVIFLLVSLIVSGKATRCHYDVLNRICKDVSFLTIGSRIENCIICAFTACLSMIQSQLAIDFIENMCIHHPNACEVLGISRAIFDVLVRDDVLIRRLAGSCALVNKIHCNFESMLFYYGAFEHILAQFPYDHSASWNARRSLKDYMRISHPYHRCSRLSYIMHAARNPDERVFMHARDRLWAADDAEYIAKNDREWWTIVYHKREITIPWEIHLGLDELLRMMSRVDSMNIPVLFAGVFHLRDAYMVHPPRAEMFACVRAVIEHDKRVIDAHGSVPRESVFGDIDEYPICVTFGSEMYNLVSGACADVDAKHLCTAV